MFNEVPNHTFSIYISVFDVGFTLTHVGYLITNESVYSITNTGLQR